MMEVIAALWVRKIEHEELTTSLIPAWIIIFFLFLPSPALAYSAKVIGVADGDTIAVLHRTHGCDTILLLNCSNAAPSEPSRSS